MHRQVVWRATAGAWRPLVEVTRRRHHGFRLRLALAGPAGGASAAGTVVSAGV